MKRIVILLVLAPGCEEPPPEDEVITCWEGALFDFCGATCEVASCHDGAINVAYCGAFDLCEANDWGSKCLESPTCPLCTEDLEPCQ